MIKKILLKIPFVQSLIKEQVDAYKQHYELKINSMNNEIIILKKKLKNLGG